MLSSKHQLREQHLLPPTLAVVLAVVIRLRLLLTQLLVRRAQQLKGGRRNDLIPGDANDAVLIGNGGNDSIYLVITP